MNRQLLYIKVVGSRGRWQKIRIIHGPKSFVLCQRRCSIVNVSIWPLVDASASLAFLIWSGSLCRVDGSWGLVAVDDRLERCGNRCGSHRWLSWKEGRVRPRERSIWTALHPLQRNIAWKSHRGFSVGKYTRWGIPFLFTFKRQLKLRNTLT